MEQSLQSVRGLPVCHVVLSGQPVAFEVRWLREVVVLEAITIVPTAPPRLLGVANLRGVALSVVDAGPTLGFASRRGREDKTLALVVTDGTVQIGLAVDRVVGLDRTDEIVPFGDTAPALHVACGRGLVRRGAEVALLLDVPKLLSRLRIEGTRAA